MLFSFVGLLLFRFEDCKLFALLLNEPPRKPRNDPHVHPGHPSSLRPVSTERRSPKLCAWRACATQAHTLSVTFAGYDIGELSRMTLSDLAEAMRPAAEDRLPADRSWFDVVDETPGQVTEYARVLTLTTTVETPNLRTEANK